MQISEQFSFLNVLCNKMCDTPNIQFCGVVNSMGNLIAGSFRDGIQTIFDNIQKEMLYMQSRLEISMKAEFDALFGYVDHIITQRKNAVIIRIPLQNQQSHLFIYAEKSADVKKIIDNALDLFVNNRRKKNLTQITNLHSDGFNATLT